ncbi:hypothetical protein X777_06928 [Ooceraea biroi]|uniref:Uncharacterized protein n=1 Tax=Ooceraea biroi TaxID=2015173 RepID=A0A026WF23_OOCBI|nr:hypothetical protein X777_06928 [Ooceraea biroi]
MDIREASITEGDFSNSSECNDTEVEELREWALSENPTIPHTRLEPLLKSLKRRLLPQVPKCAKTFLGATTANYNIQNFNNDKGSEFIYFGVTNHLQQSINLDLQSVPQEPTARCKGVKASRNLCLRKGLIFITLDDRVNAATSFLLSFGGANATNSPCTSYVARSLVRVSSLRPFQDSRRIDSNMSGCHVDAEEGA